MAIIYPDIDSIGWGDDVNDNFRELSQNDTDIKATIGTETIGTTATTLKGAIKEVKGIADNNTAQLNALTQKTDSIRHKGAVVEGNGTNKVNVVLDGVQLKHDAFVVNANPLANDVIIVGTSLINNQQDIEVTFNKETSAPIQLGILYFV